MKAKFTSLVITVVIIISCAFTGCSGNTEPKDKPSLGIVIGAHKYNPTFTVSQELSDKILNISKNFGNVSVTVSSGTPKSVANWSLDVEKKDVGEAKLNQIAKANTQVIIQEIATLKADSPEVNTLSAIIKEANNLHDSEASTKTLIVYDTGLSTTGLLDFTTGNLINSSPSFIADQLEAHHSLPDLTGIDVFWSGCGQTRGEQILDDENRFKLKAIWSEIINRCNPKRVYFNDAELTSETDNDLPEVSMVNTISSKIEVEQINETVPVISIEEDEVGFEPDTADFVDPSNAKATLSSLAATLCKTDETIYVIGSTASFGSSDSSKSLSKKRAATVVQTLIDNGVNKDSLVSIGIGQAKCSLRVNDIDANGNLVEEQAVHNRAVFLVPASNSICSKLKSEGIL